MSDTTMNIRVTVGKKEDNLKNILNKIDAEKRALFCKEALVQHVLNIKNGSAVSAYVDKFELMTDEEKKLASAVTMQDLKDLFSTMLSGMTLNPTATNNNNDTKEDAKVEEPVAEEVVATIPTNLDKGMNATVYKEQAPVRKERKRKEEPPM